MATKKKAKAKAKVDFDDEDSVKEYMAKVLDVDLDDVSIEEDRGLGGFGTDTVYTVEAGHEYKVVRNHDAMEELAIAVVKQDLEQEPEIFDKDFIKSHIDTEHLRKELYDDVFSSALDSATEEAKDRPLKFIEEYSLDCPEPSKEKLREYAEAMSDEETSAEEIMKRFDDMTAEEKWEEMGEEPKVKDKDIEDVAETNANAQLKDPMSYLEDIYGDEAGEKAIEIAGIDVDAAAKEAVSTDGAEHFLCRYDNNYTEGPGGIIYWRDN